MSPRDDASDDNKNYSKPEKLLSRVLVIFLISTQIFTCSNSNLLNLIT